MAGAKLLFSPFFGFADAFPRSVELTGVVTINNL